jgi:hypothetical protein
MIPTDLELIEERHKASDIGWCEGCDGATEPCDVVRLARALDEIRRDVLTQYPSTRLRGIAERALREVAGGTDD